MPNLTISDFLKHPSLEVKDGIYRQKDLLKFKLFEDRYTGLRSLESRFYDDVAVGRLPDIDPSHPTAREWSMRKRSANRLIKHLRANQPQTILEVGCGNGWLINRIHSVTKSVCVGVDVSEAELNQASRVFGHGERLHFIYADIFSEVFDKPMADAIILASTIQYFPDAKELIGQLLGFLNPEGQIHIFDSPFYTKNSSAAAEDRTEKYFKEMGHEEMRKHYFHHTWDELNGFQYSVIYNPNSFLRKIERQITPDSPFPWIVLTKPIKI
jgi:ubiquinone/menaquinone biosynthesis C-methylase UbiE